MADATDRGRVAATAKYSFRNLASWRKAQDLADEILEVVPAMPNNRVANILVQQIVKSSTSIAANICEGHGRFSPGAYRNHLSIARGSANETIGWLDLLCRRRFISSAQLDHLTDLTEEILRMISAQMIQLDRQGGVSRTVRDEQVEYEYGVEGSDV